jgi:hypothetical protein
VINCQFIDVSLAFLSKHRYFPYNSISILINNLNFDGR